MPPRRWSIAAAGTVLQLALGTVYAWSYFQKPMAERYGWSNSQVAWTFCLAICCLGLAAAWAGVQLPRFGPRRLAMTGGALFGLGHLVAAAALAWKSLPLLYLGYGVLGGAGLGLGYVTPVATVAKWFPDRKGLATGTVIMGFGFGALLMSKVFAPLLYRTFDGDLVMMFACLGAGFTLAVPAVASVLRNPPADFTAGRPSTGQTLAAGGDSEPPAEASIVSLQFAAIWLVFFANILVGISLISFQSPLLQSLWSRFDASVPPATLAEYGATLIAVSSLFNGVGRMFWGGLSDRIGRAWTFRVMLGSQFVLLAAMIEVVNPWWFAATVCYILLCYGGGFGAMPSLVLDAFGPQRMAVAYGAALTAWSAAGVVGPQLVAWLNDRYAADLTRYVLLTAAVVLAAGLLLSVGLRDRPRPVS